MENLTIKLAELDGEAVVTAKNLRLEFQPTHMNGNSLEDGNFSITGDQEFMLKNNQPAKTQLNPIYIRLKEMEVQLAAMANGAEKIKLQSRVNIWKAFLTGVQTALGVALKADYQLENPVVEGGAE